MSSVELVYDEAFLGYDFGPYHPLNSMRQKLTYDLIGALGLLDSGRVRVVAPRTASEDEALLFHAPEYVVRIKKASVTGEGLLDLGDTPAFKGCYETTLLCVGGSLTAVEEVMEGRAKIAFNMGGGFHHAHPDRASGFCIFNDVAIAIAHLKKRYGVRRLLYLDIDAHQGDGVMYGFYHDPSILDIDFHESGRYLFPGTGSVREDGEGEGRGYKINLPLPPLTPDEPYLYAFHELVPPLTRAYKPQVILLQAGVDAHRGDGLTHMALTTRTYREVARTLRNLAEELTEGRVIIFGGGGYDLGNVARCWTAILAEMAQLKAEERLPEGWRRGFEATAQREAPLTLYDEEPPISAVGEGKVLSEVKDMVEEVKRRALWAGLKVF